MSGQYIFSARDFTCAEDPWQYLQQTEIADGAKSLSADAANELLELSDELDELHLAIALVVAEHNCPKLFALLAAKCLGHDSMSVRINAYRVLRAVPQQSIDDELVQAVNAGLSLAPKLERYDDALVR